MNFMVIIYCVLICLFAAVLLLAAYCRFERARAQKVLDHYKQANSPENAETKKRSRQLLSIAYRLAYGFTRYAVIQVGKIPSFFIRNLCYRFIFCMDITKNTVINGGCEFRSPWNIHADRCIISNHCILDGRSEIYIGQNVVFGVCVHIWTMEHSINDPYFRVLAENAKPVTIGERCWICSDVTILPGCKIEEGIVVAARACVTQNCDEPFGVYGGIPARKIGERTKELKYTTDSKPCWMFY